METVEELIASAIRGFVISLMLALVVSLTVTRSVIVSAAATACIGASSLGFVGLQGLLGWPFGVIESICATIVVGIACDYTMHVAVTMVRHGGDLRQALSLTGPPLCAAAATTTVGGAALLPCTLLLFSRFGAFVVVTVATAFGFALVVLPALLLCSGAAFLTPSRVGTSCGSAFTPDSSTRVAATGTDNPLSSEDSCPTDIAAGTACELTGGASELACSASELAGTASELACSATSVIGSGKRYCRFL